MELDRVPLVESSGRCIGTLMNQIGIEVKQHPHQQISYHPDREDQERRGFPLCMRSVDLERTSVTVSSVNPQDRNGALNRFLP